MTIPIFEPLEWQKAAWRDTSPILLCSGEAGGGKSIFAANKIHGMCLKYPGSMGLMLRKTRESCRNSIVLMMQRGVIGSDPRVRFIPSAFRFEYSNGSILAWGGMANQDQREAIRSIGQDGALDWVWMEEAHLFSRDDFDEILARMRGKAAKWSQIIITTNPDAPGHWIRKDLILGKQAAYHKSSWRENNHNPKRYEDALNQLQGTTRMRLRDGLWVQAEGSIFPEWDARFNIDAEAEYDPSLPYFVGMDVGYSNPTCVLFMQERFFKGKPDRVIVFDEYYRNERTSQNVINDIWGNEDAEIEGMGYKDSDCDYIYIDPAAAEMNASLQASGLAVWSAYNKVVPTVNVVRRFIKDNVGEVRLIVNPRCKNLIEQIPGYRNKVSTSGETKADVNPIKRDDHAVDALRYALGTRYIYE